MEGFWVKSQNVLSFIQKHIVLFALILVLVLQFVPNNEGGLPWGGMWMRMQVKNLPVADSAAASSIENFMQQQAESIAAKNYPNLPEENRRKVVEDLKKKVREENKAQLQSEQDRLAQEIRDHYSYDVDGRKFLYMPDIDPYYYLRFSRNIIEKGHVYDELKDGTPWDNHMIAPIGAPADTSWHPQLLALMYRIHSLFDSKVTLMEAANYFPIVFIFLSLIFAFLVANRVSGPIGGFFAVTMLALSPAIIGRTPWGHADTDSYSIFFPVLIVWLLFEALSAKSSRRQLVFGALTGLAFGMYANFWAGWWYLFDFVGGAFVIAILVDLVIHRGLLRQGLNVFWTHANARKFVSIGLTVFIVTAIFSSFTIGFSSFFNSAFKAAIGYTALKEAALPNLWPNTLTTVAELNPASLSEIINSVGGRLMFFIGLLGILLLLLKRDEHGRLDLTYSSLLVIWFAGTTYMAFKGTRFIMLLGPAFAIAFGAAAGLLYIRLSAFGEKQLHLNKIITGLLLFVILGLIIVNPVKAGTHMVRDAYNSVINDVPIMNDAWWNAQTKIKEDSKPDAIINSWWDFGHHFKFVADRAVTFDGASQNLPHAHWVGRVLQTDSEEEAIAILRMLDCGANSAYDVAVGTMNDSLMAIKLVKNLIMMDKESARLAAKEAGVPESILDFTHCDPPEDYFIASGDMIGKSGVWAHFGMWDFERAETWVKWRLLDQSAAVPQMVARFNISDQDAKQLYYDAVALDSEDAANQWISPWPGYLGDASSCQNQDDLLLCGTIAINLSAKRAEVTLPQGIALAGKIIVYARDGSKKELKPADGNENLAIIVWPSGSGFNALSTYSVLADSIFTKLYFMKGFGLKHFRPFDEQSQLIGGMIYVYKIDWQATELYVPQELKPKESVETGAQVLLNYIGWTDDGQVFDSSIPGWKEKNISQYVSFESFETRPLSFVAGQDKLIPGFERQIVGMKSGEVKTITVAPEEAYGLDPSKHPLGNKTLHFKVRIEAVQ